MSDALDEVREKCEEAGLEVEDRGEELTVFVPQGNGTHGVFVFCGIHAEFASKEPFEDYQLLEGFWVASWSPKHQVIECSLSVDIGPSELERIYLLKRDILNSRGNEILAKGVLKKLDPDFDTAAPLNPQQRVRFDTSTGLSISIGPMSNVHGILQGVEPPGDNVAYLTLQIEGTTVTTHDSAVELLERVGNAALFNVDLSRDVTLTLQRWFYRYAEEPEAAGPIPPTVGPIPPIELHYDREAMSLYWNARAASTMPLLQFLAYYQVLEFYFPIYSKTKALKTLRQILKDPRFDPQRDADIARLLEAIRVSPKGRKIGGNEASQLTATLQECVTLYDLRTFLIAENENRYKFYMSDRPKKISKHMIPVREAKFDHREYVAKRIYDIRCRIVHTKAGFDETPLLPADPETKDLYHDIALVEFLAREVLKASSVPLYCA